MTKIILDLFRTTTDPDGSNVDRWEGTRAFATMDAMITWLGHEELTTFSESKYAVTGAFQAQPYEHDNDRVTTYAAHLGTRDGYSVTAWRTAFTVVPARATDAGN